VLSIPLGFSLREIITEAKARSIVSNLIRRKTVTFSGVDIRRLWVEAEGDRLAIDLEVIAPAQSISENQVRLVHGFLETELDRSIDLDVRIIPVEAYDVLSSTPE